MYKNKTKLIIRTKQPLISDTIIKTDKMETASLINRNFQIIFRNQRSFGTYYHFSFVLSTCKSKTLKKQQARNLNDR